MQALYHIKLKNFRNFLNCFCVKDTFSALGYCFPQNPAAPRRLSIRFFIPVHRFPETGHPHAAAADQHFRHMARSGIQQRVPLNGRSQHQLLYLVDWIRRLVFRKQHRPRAVVKFPIFKGFPRQHQRHRIVVHLRVNDLQRMHPHFRIFLNLPKQFNIVILRIPAERFYRMETKFPIR